MTEQGRNRAGDATYRINELGWLQFEGLCTELLALDGSIAADRWHGNADEIRTALRTRA